MFLSLMTHALTLAIYQRISPASTGKSKRFEKFDRRQNFVQSRDGCFEREPEVSNAFDPDRDSFVLRTSNAKTNQERERERERERRERERERERERRERERERDRQTDRLEEIVELR